jgi:hypothetical protein
MRGRDDNGPFFREIIYSYGRLDVNAVRPK